MPSPSRTQGRPFLTPGQGPLEEDVAPFDKIRDAIALRVPSLDALSHEAVDLAAEALSVLHQQLHGRASVLHGHRPPKTRRQQLRGEDPLPVEDLAFLLLEAPRSVVLALDVLARRAGHRVVPMDVSPPTFAEAQARVAEAAGSLGAACARANADGVVEPHEARGILSCELAQAKRYIAQLEARLAQYQHELDHHA